MKFLRYQPIPAGRKPPAPPVALVSSKGPSMLQSWGTSNRRQAESLNAAVSAFVKSPRAKDQSASNESVSRGGGAAWRSAVHSRAKAMTSDEFPMTKEVLNSRLI